MTVKKEYAVGDTVWVYGVNIKNTPTKGRIVHRFEIPDYHGTQYIIAIPTEIEDLLEVRTWENISQDERGPVGALRSLGEGFYSTKKFVSKVGFTINDGTEDLDDPTDEEIHAALEKARKAVIHEPLHIKESKPKRRFYNRKKKS